MTRITASWDELNDVWPWSRVLAAVEAARWRAYEHAYPVTQLTAYYLHVHKAKGASVPSLTDLLLPSANPFARREKPVYTRGVIRAFNEAFARKLTGNAHLATFGTRELRASGWKGERYTP